MILTDILLGKSIRIIHGLLPYIIITIALYSNKIICEFTIFFVIIILILFMHYGGCFISNYEKKLLNDNINVVDIYLKLFNLEINRSNRKYVSLYGIVFLQVLIIIIYYYRYGVISNPYGS